jgi:hypothetical protein
MVKFLEIINIIKNKLVQQPFLYIGKCGEGIFISVIMFILISKYLAIYLIMDGKIPEKIRMNYSNVLQQQKKEYI